MPVQPAAARSVTPTAARPAVAPPAARTSPAPAAGALRGNSTFQAARPAGRFAPAQSRPAAAPGVDACEAAKPRYADCIRPALIPTEKQLEEIHVLLLLSTSQMGEKQEKLFQEAIDKTIKYYGIPISSLQNGRVIFDSTIQGIGGKAEANGTMRIGIGMMQEAIEYGPNMLAAGISHESTHIRQLQLHGEPGTESADADHSLLYETQTVAGYELMAYEDGLRMAKYMKLPAKLVQQWTAAAEEYRQILTPENMERFNSEGRYWELGALPGQSGPLPERHNH